MEKGSRGIHNLDEVRNTGRDLDKSHIEGGILQGDSGRGTAHKLV